MKSAFLDGFPDLHGLVSMSIYETNPVHCLLMCCNTIKWVQKKRQVHDPKTKMVRDAHFLRLNVNDSYNHNPNSVDLSDQLQNMYRVDHWMCKYKWGSYIFYFGAMASSLSVRKLFTENSLKRAR